MNREDAREQLSAYLDGELDAAARDALKAALAEDAELRAELDALRRTVALVQSLPQRQAPAGLAGRVVAVLESDPIRPQGWVRRWGPVVLAAAACLVIGLLTTMGPGREDVRSGARYVAPEGETATENFVREGEALEPTPLAEEAERDMSEAAAGPEASAVSKAKRAFSVSKKADSTLTRAPGAPSPAVSGKMLEVDAAAAGASYYGAAALASQTRAGREAAVEGQALLDDIRRASKARARGEYKRRDAAGPGNGSALRVTVQYDRLEPCLREIRAALERQQATYVVQPVGSGQFTIEASLPEGSVRALVAGIRLRTEERWRMTKGEKLKVESQAERVQEATALVEQAKPAADAPRRLVHLILHFEHREAAAGAPAKP